MPLRATLIFIQAFSVLTSCRTTESASVESSSGISVKATNRNFIAMEVYAVAAGRRLLLGRLAAGATRTYNIPDEIFANDMSLRFQLESVDRTVNILTEPIFAVSGEEIILIIPNER